MLRVYITTEVRQNVADVLNTPSEARCQCAEILNVACMSNKQYGDPSPNPQTALLLTRISFNLNMDK